MSIREKITNAAKKLRGDPLEEKQVNHSNAHLPTDSKEKAEHPESSLYQVLGGNSLETVAGVAAA